MSHSRREFIKFVVAGSVASGCPVDAALIPAPDSKPAAAPRVDGEHFAICHQVRDGRHFEHPVATSKTDIVIVGFFAIFIDIFYDLLINEQIWAARACQFNAVAVVPFN